MTIFLTALAVLLAVTIAALISWEIAHGRSAMVAAWRRPSFPARVTGGLGLRTGGSPHAQLRDDEAQTVVLLHGSGGSSDSFGDAYEGLANEHRVVAVDLLGFGRSVDASRTDYSIDAHVEAIGAALGSLGADRDRICVAADAMGGAVALRFAARHPERTTRIVLWSPPVLPDGPGSRLATDAELVAAAGPLTRMVMGEGRAMSWARRRLGRHGALAGWLIAAAVPSLPVPLARSALHDVDGWRASFTALVFDADWSGLYAEAGAPITVFQPVDVSERSDGFDAAQRNEGCTVVPVPGADRHLAVTRPHLLFDVLGA